MTRARALGAGSCRGERGYRVGVLMIKAALAKAGRETARLYIGALYLGIFIRKWHPRLATSAEVMAHFSATIAVFLHVWEVLPASPSSSAS
jgi:hypothetical protein